MSKPYRPQNWLRKHLCMLTSGFLNRLLVFTSKAFLAHPTCSSQIVVVTRAAKRSSSIWRLKSGCAGEPYPNSSHAALY